MKRRNFVVRVAQLVTAGLLYPFRARAADDAETARQLGIEPLKKPLPEWRKLLSPAEYHVLFEQGTERAYSSPLYEEHRKGTYVCTACKLPLFDSDTKLQSG